MECAKLDSMSSRASVRPFDGSCADAVMTLPAGVAEISLAGDGSLAWAAGTSGGVEGAVRHAADELARRAADGRLPPAVAALLKDADGSAVAAEALSDVVSFREAARDALSAGRTDVAAALAGPILLAPGGAADGLLVLAICAARLGRYADGASLAVASLAERAGHPRTLVVAGFCELGSGDRKAAQNHLATAARMARRSPDGREDLRAAQRLLLLMHLE